jgi:hypothetical protein
MFSLPITPKPSALAGHRKHRAPCMSGPTSMEMLFHNNADVQGAQQLLRHSVLPRVALLGPHRHLDEAASHVDRGHIAMRICMRARGHTLAELSLGPRSQCPRDSISPPSLFGPGCGGPRHTAQSGRTFCRAPAVTLDALAIDALGGEPHPCDWHHQSGLRALDAHMATAPQMDDLCKGISSGLLLFHRHCVDIFGP